MNEELGIILNFIIRDKTFTPLTFQRVTWSYNLEPTNIDVIQIYHENKCVRSNKYMLYLVYEVPSRYIFLCRMFKQVLCGKNSKNSNFKFLLEFLNSKNKFLTYLRSTHMSHIMKHLSTENISL